MREEYFMNYDFLRKHGEKIDSKGRSFRMLDFEDGGMYFGVVEGDLPSGLGAFVYSDLKFHCGIYKNGLMNGQARIHFGNGDVFDGESTSGQMEGEGFFFDCENNDWVFGIFEEDNCIEVIESGEGFPRQEISKFRSHLHQHSGCFINRNTEICKLDLDILFEYATRDISAIKGGSLSQPEEPQFMEEEELEALEERDEEASDLEVDDKAKKHKLHEFYKNALRNQELLKDPKPLPHEKYLKGHNVKKNIHCHKSKNIVQVSKKDKSKDRRSNKESIHSSPSDISPQERIGVPFPEHQSMSPGSFQPVEVKKPKSKWQELGHLKQTSGNQIATEAYVVKPRGARGHRDHHEGPDSDLKSYDLNGNRLPEFSNVSSLKERDDSREIRNISIQTEDHHAEHITQNEEVSLSYLKGIHSMIDELKQIVTQNMASGAKAEHLYNETIKVSKQVQAAEEFGKAPHQILSKLSEVKLQVEQSFGMVIPGKINFESIESEMQWNSKIDQELEARRMKEIEEALASKFGKGIDFIEVDENNIGEELEPIKESVDEEEEDVDGLPDKLPKPEKMSIPGLPEQIDIRELDVGIQWNQGGNQQESTIEECVDRVSTQDNFFNAHPVNADYSRARPPLPVLEYQSRGHSEVPLDQQITESDEKEFYNSRPRWHQEEEKSSRKASNNLPEVSPITIEALPPLQYNSGSRRSDHSSQKITHEQSCQANIEELTDVKGSQLYSRPDPSPTFGPTTLSQSKLLLPPVPEPDFTRESNFMYSKNSESRNNSNGFCQIQSSSIDKPLSRIQPWFFLNPYLYEVTDDIDFDTV